MSLVKLFLALDVIDSAGGVSNVAASTLANLTTMIATSDDVIAQDVYDEDGGSASIERVIADYGLTGSSPSPEEEYWGDVRITASDVASLLYQALSTEGHRHAGWPRRWRRRPTPPPTASTRTSA